AEIIAGRLPRNAMDTAMVNEANSPTRGSTPAMMENEIASGISARATTSPARTSVRSRRGLRNAPITEVTWSVRAFRRCTGVRRGIRGPDGEGTSVEEDVTQATPKSTASESPIGYEQGGTPSSRAWLTDPRVRALGGPQ